MTTGWISQRVAEIRERIRWWWWWTRLESPVRFKKIVQEVWFRLTRYWMAVVLLVAAVFVGALIWIFWCVLAQWIDCLWTWGRTGASGDSKTETLRNLVLAIGGGGAAVIGLLLAIWRSGLAHLQTKTAERGLNNERYQKGAEMLGSATPATRMGGVYALETLARERPYDYHVQITKLLCAFIRHPADHDNPEAKAANGEGEGESAITAPAGKERKKTCPPAIQAAAQVLGKRSKKQIRIERREGFRLDLTGANLSGASLRHANLSGGRLQDTDLSGADLSFINLLSAGLSRADLSGADLLNANLSSTNLRDADLSGAKLMGAHLTRARLWGADLSRALMLGAILPDADLERADLSDVTFTDATLSGVNLSGATLDKVKTLTQRQLDGTFIWKGREPPTLVGAVDCQTGEPLKWQGEVRHRSFDPSVLETLTLQASPGTPTRYSHAPEKTAD